MSLILDDLNILTININHKNFKVKYTQNLLIKVLQIREKVINSLKEIPNNPENYEEVNNFYNNINKTVQDGIDIALGNGSSEELFKEREQDCFESIKVLEYIISKITSYSQNNYNKQSKSVHKTHKKRKYKK